MLLLKILLIYHWNEVPDILCSALTDDCIGRGKHLKEGGAVYDYISGLQVGIANLSDSLAAIKKLVFEEERISPKSALACTGNRLCRRRR